MSARLAMYVDTSLCMACRGCQVACKQWNDLSASTTANTGSYENPPRLAPNTWTRITFHEYDDGQRLQWLFLNQGCMHCGKAACVDVCPTGALKHAANGIVTFRREVCNGCGYCSQFCPFGVPKLAVTNVLTGEAKSSKCVFCQDRTTNGLKPACVKTCPAGALDWGDREAMIAQARNRVQVLQSQFGFAQASVYGEAQLGGLGRLYVLTAPPAAYGLDPNPAYPIASTLWQRVLQPLGGVAFGATLAGLIAAWALARRNVRMEEVE